MLTELLLLAGAGLLGKKAIENPDKTKEFIGKMGDAMANEAMKSGNKECIDSANKYYEAKAKQIEKQNRINERNNKESSNDEY